MKDRTIPGEPSLADILIVSRDTSFITSTGKTLKENLYGVSVASDGDQVLERLRSAWVHLVLIDLDSIDVPESHLAEAIRKVEPDVPIIGLGHHPGGSCPVITYLDKPLTTTLIKKTFPIAISEKETHRGRKAMKGLIVAAFSAFLLWIILFWFLG